MGDVGRQVFKPIGKLFGIEAPRAPDTQAALDQSKELGIPESAPKDIDEGQRRKALEQRRKAMASKQQDQRNLLGTSNTQGTLIGGNTAGSNGGSRLIGY